MTYCSIDPPEQPEPIVYLIEPYVSAMCSFSMDTASAETTMFWFWPWVFRELFATMKPRESAMSTSTGCGGPFEWCTAALGPNAQTTLWFQPACGAQGAHCFEGSDSTAMS